MRWWLVMGLVACVEPGAADVPLGQAATLPAPTVGPLVPGHKAEIQIDAPAGALIYVVGGPGVGAGPCPAPLGGSCLDVVNAVLLGTARANSGGVATLEIDVPPTLPIGASVGVQALQITASAVSLSPAVADVVDDPSDLCDRSGGTMWSAGAAEAECDLLDLINDMRAQGAVCGGTTYPPVPPLVMNEPLRLASRVHSDWMFNNSFGHASPGGPLGETMAQRATAAGYRWRSIWENIARGQPGPVALMNDWSTSTSHCRNIMRSASLDLGVGRGGTQGSRHWTAMFGQPR